MKNTMISLTALAILGMSSNVMAAPTELGVSQSSFQWAGTVPSISTSAGYFIIPSTDKAFDSGILTFANSPEGVKLTTSSEIGFRVVKDATVDASGYVAADDTVHLAYKFGLTNIKVGLSGLVSEQLDTTPYFAVQADGVDLVKRGTHTDKPNTSNETNLKVVQTESGVNSQPSQGDSVVVQALLTVTAFDI